MAKRYYIAYGSNLNVQQMKYRCPDAKIVGTAIVKGYELLYKGSMTGSYLTIEKKKGGKVPVAVWEVSKADEERLDIYEGFPTFYYKKAMRLPVKTLKGEKKLDTFVYIMHEEREIGIPHQTYIRVCEEGYHFFGFDIEYLEDAYNRSVQATIEWEDE